MPTTRRTETPTVERAPAKRRFRSPPDRRGIAAAGLFVLPYPGTIHIELGRARVRLEGSVDPGSLRLILEHLGR